jgi:hypothetical protein
MYNDSVKYNRRTLVQREMDKGGEGLELYLCGGRGG